MKYEGDGLDYSIRWNRTSERLPSTDPDKQVKVLFYSPGWATPFMGMYQHLPEEYPAEYGARWSEYSSYNDRYVDFLCKEPTFWAYLEYDHLSE